MTDLVPDVRWQHRVRVGSHETNAAPAQDRVREHRDHIEPWLAALLQSEHLSLLVGSGLTTAIAGLTKTVPLTMGPGEIQGPRAVAVRADAARGAKRLGRDAPNIEDVVRAVRALIDGLATLLPDDGTPPDVTDVFAKEARELHASWKASLAALLATFRDAVAATEAGIRKALLADDGDARDARRVLGAFLLTFASRTSSRERLHVFTTNYDRLIEFGCDLLGVRILDRFIGEIEPSFRTSRLGIDLHYNPPGIRGEPRYLEGVVRLTKLHGSIDWRHDRVLGDGGRIVRNPLPFGGFSGASAVGSGGADELMIYPNAAKDVETLAYPYAELFRDFAAATCQPNSVLVTYGYGFGDDHVNRTIRDMLTIPSSHLAIVSWDDAGGRIPRFCQQVGRDEQITLLVGNHFGDLRTLVEHYLPKPAIDQTTWRMMDLLNRRNDPRKSSPPRSRADLAAGQGSASDKDEGW